MGLIALCPIRSKRAICERLILGAALGVSTIVGSRSLHGRSSYNLRPFVRNRRRLSAVFVGRFTGHSRWRCRWPRRCRPRRRVATNVGGGQRATPRRSSRDVISEEVMSTVEVRNDTIRETSVDLELEAVVVPGADVDRPQEFYARRGWGLDDDFVFDDGFGVVPFKPPGSGCSVHFGTNMTSAAPTSADRLYLIVSDVSAARNERLPWGADVSGVFHRDPGAQFQPDGASGRASDPA